MIAKAVSRWALRALALLALKTVVQVARERAYLRGNARRSPAPARPSSKARTANP
jgi:hypothetical protein